MKARRSVIVILLAIVTILCMLVVVSCKDKDDPGGQNPGGQNPGGQNPGGQNPGGQNPGGDDPVEGPETGEYFAILGSLEITLKLHDVDKASLTIGGETSEGTYTITDNAVSCTIEIDGEETTLTGTYATTTITVEYDGSELTFYKKGINYTVSFETNGGSAIADKTVENGRKIGSVSTTKADHVFVSWHTDSTLSAASVFDLDTPITSNVKLYANWQAVDPNVLFEVGSFADELSVSGAKVHYGETFTFPVVTISDEVYGNVYIFDGWFTEEDGGDRITDEKGVGLAAWAVADEVESTTLYAHYENILVFEEDVDGLAVRKGPAIVRVTEVKIPAQFEGKTIVTVPAEAFSVCYTLTTIKIPNTVRSLAYEKTVVGNKTLNSAFIGCPNIENIEIYDAELITSPVYSSADSAIIHNATKTVVYYPMARAGSVEIPEGVEVIDDNVFEYSFITEVHIPASVKTIGWAAFNDASWLEIVDIKQGNGSVNLSIDDWAFAGCVSLREISLPARMTEFGNYALSNCPSLENINVGTGNKLYSSHDGILATPDGETLLVFPGSKQPNDDGGKYTIPNNFKTIAAGAFSGAIPNITCLYISPYIETINSGAFKDCVLSEISFENNSIIEEIGDSLFANSYISKVTLSESITSIGDNAFYKSSLAEIVIPENSKLETIGDYALYSTKITQIAIPESVNSIGEYALALLDITSITIPEGVESIGDYVLAYNRKLVSIELPSSLTQIGKSAFISCESLAEITLPASLVELGDGAFYGCYALEKIDVEQDNTVYSSYDGVLATDNGATLLFFPKQKSVGADGVYTIPENITTIAQGAFDGVSYAKRIYFPSELVSIEVGAFTRNCEFEVVSFEASSNITELGANWFSYVSISKIVLPENIQVIGEESLKATGIVEIVFPENSKLETIEDGALWGTEIVELQLPAGVTTIGNQAFYNIPSLVSIYIPDSVTEIGNRAFANDVALKSVRLPASITTYDEYFNGCSSIEEFDAPGLEGVVELVDGSIVVLEDAGSASLNSASLATASEYVSDDVYYVPEGETEVTKDMVIAAGAFTKVVFPSSVTSIAASAFLNSNVEEIVFAVGIGDLSIGANAFKGSKLASIIFDGVPTSLSIGMSAFENTKFVELELANVTSIGQYAFGSASLTSLKLSGSFATIPMNMCDGASALETIVIESSSPLVVSSSAFRGFSSGLASLRSVVLNASVTQIASSAFQGDANLTEVVLSDPNALTTIGANAFNGTAIRSFVIGKNVTSIGNTAFGATSAGAANSNLEEVIFIEGGYQELTFGTAFRYAVGLKRIKLPERVTTIPKQAFEGCVALEEVILPSTLTSIGAQAFADCTSIKSIVIPKLVTDFGDTGYSISAFNGWTSEQTIYVAGVRNLRDTWFNDGDANVVLLELQDEQ